jgi:hypothetical protein
VRALAEELAISLELQEDRPENWSEETIKLLKNSAQYLLKRKVQLPNPVTMVLSRRLDSMG